jgi:hypothetical protein
MKTNRIKLPLDITRISYTFVLSFWHNVNNTTSIVHILIVVLTVVLIVVLIVIQTIRRV